MSHELKFKSTSNSIEWLWKNLGFCIFPVAKVVIGAGLGEISGGGVICSVWMPLLPYAGQEDIEQLF
jgi:hypothetical protein